MYTPIFYELKPLRKKTLRRYKVTKPCLNNILFKNFFSLIFESHSMAHLERFYSTPMYKNPEKWPKNLSGISAKNVYKSQFYP